MHIKYKRKWRTVSFTKKQEVSFKTKVSGFRRVGSVTKFTKTSTKNSKITKKKSKFNVLSIFLRSVISLLKILLTCVFSPFTHPQVFQKGKQSRKNWAVVIEGGHRFQNFMRFQEVSSSNFRRKHQILSKFEVEKTTTNNQVFPL